MQLITYTDRFAGDLQNLKKLMDTEFQGLFSGVHILPFFDPIDGADAGFDPSDHTTVDHRLGDWSDIAAIGEHYIIMADIIVNHVSARSPQFTDVIKHGEASEYWRLFLKKSDIFPTAESEKHIAKIYRPRPTPPFTPITVGNGQKTDFWTTFSPDQIDINVQIPEGEQYLTVILDRFSASGVKEIRLDAAGYAIKREGTRCFMLPETFDFIATLSEKARERGIDTLVEIHSHYQTQIEIANRVGRVYDFAIPPLVLHTLFTQDANALKNWLTISPRNCVTVLDTHDGIGILDVGKDGNLPGLLEDHEVDNLVETIHAKSKGESRKASGESASNLDIYQVNCTFYDALGQDDNAYLIARAIQFFAPGEPQVYYVGLLAGKNDMDLLDKTTVGRDINRHYYASNDEIQEEMKRPVVKSLIDLMRVRNSATAFAGTFELGSGEDQEVIMNWKSSNSAAHLHVDLAKNKATIRITEGEQTSVYMIENGQFS